MRVVYRLMCLLLVVGLVYSFSVGPARTPVLAQAPAPTSTRPPLPPLATATPPPTVEKPASDHQGDDGGASGPTVVPTPVVVMLPASGQDAGSPWYVSVGLVAIVLGFLRSFQRRRR